MVSQTELLRRFVLDNLEYFEPAGDEGGYPVLPEFDLYARDFLSFAAEELEGQDERSLINCVTHLKRAMDCQLDVFLYAFELAKLFQRRGLGVQKKLGFLEEAGVFASQTLSRLNTIRNRMEHLYEVPKIDDLEVYHDLVVAFVSVLERAMLLTRTSVMEFEIVTGHEERYMASQEDPVDLYPVDSFRIKYHFDGPRITAEWDTEEEQRSLTADVSDIHEFSYFFRVLFLLSHRGAFASDKYIISQL